MAAVLDTATMLRQRLLGAWRMRSWTRKLIATGEVGDAFGPAPFGYIHYGPDGRMMVFALRGNRPRPVTNPPTDAEKRALYDSMFAYVGHYEVHADRVVHTIDGSWNELWTGTVQTRLVAFDGDRLVYTTPETVDPMDGNACIYTVTYERA